MRDRGATLRATLAKWLSPVFEAIVRRLDPAVEFDDHERAVSEIVRRAAGRESAPADRIWQEVVASGRRPGSGPPADLERLLDQWLLGPIETPDAISANSAIVDSTTTEEGWTNDAASAADQALRIASLAADPAWLAQHGGEAGLAVLRGFPPSRWFVFKRGAFAGSSRLLHSLLLASEIDLSAARRSDLRLEGSELHRGTVDVLDRLTKSIEVRRDEALRFADAARLGDGEETVERMRFALLLMRGARDFGDLRYLNTAMKLVDRGLREIRRDAHENAEHAYAFAFAYQEASLEEVLTE